MTSSILEGKMTKKNSLFKCIAMLFLFFALTSCSEKDLGKLDETVSDEQCAVLHATLKSSAYLLRVDDKIVTKERIAAWDASSPMVIKLPAGSHTIVFADVSDIGWIPLKPKELKIKTKFEAGKEYTIERDVKFGGLSVDEDGIGVEFKSKFRIVPYTKK